MNYTRPICDYDRADTGLFLGDCRWCAARMMSKSPLFFAAKLLNDKRYGPYATALEERGLTHEEVKDAAAPTSPPGSPA